jgi:hypothetical protein
MWREATSMLRSRDGFEVVNSLLHTDANRRSFLKVLGWAGAGLI